MTHISMIGFRTGKLTVIEKSDYSRYGEVRWICKCDCGTVTQPIPGSDLRKGRYVSCGCAKKENKPLLKHGGTNTKLYGIYKTMKQRCENSRSAKYHYYGGRGIKVCDEWCDFIPFRDWALSNGYSEGLTLDRIDNNGNYCPENCRWVSMKQQSNNRRNNIFVEVNGVTKTVAEWSDCTGISVYTLYYRARRGVTGYAFIEGAKYDPY